MVWSIIIPIAVVLIIIFIFFSYYNSFVTLDQRMKNSKSQITVQLKKRTDLVPNLVKSVKGYLKHERGVLTDVTKARTAMMKATGFEGKVKAGAGLADALKSLFAVAENYPDLKASQNFMQLQQEVSNIEDKIAYARQYFNDSILAYNTMVERLPGKWFASMFGFKKQKYFEIPEEQKSVPEINF